MSALGHITRKPREWIETGRLSELIFARNHSPFLTRQRLDAFVTRIRLVTVALAVLTLAWIALDAWTLPAPEWLALALMRCLAAMVFLALAWQPRREPGRLSTLVMLGLMLFMPLTIYAASQHLLAHLNLSGAAAINAQLYQALPWIVLAGLSIFPLVAAEGLVLVLLISSSVMAINLFSTRQPGEIALATLLIMLLVSGAYLLACAIQLHYMMALLRRANHDPLTSVLTRHSGTELLGLHWRLALELNQPLSLLFLDVDDFKDLNDRHGHDAGDRALQTLVRQLQQGLRQGDMIIRWGGEEFLVLLVNTPATGACTVLQQVCRGGFGVRPDGNPLTASIGLAERVRDRLSSWQEMIELADRRMYAAKAAGKACCACGLAPPSKLPTPAGSLQQVLGCATRPGLQAA